MQRGRWAASFLLILGLLGAAPCQAQARPEIRVAAYNVKHGITPETVKKAVFDMDPTAGTHDYVVIPILKKGVGEGDPELLPELIEELRSEMLVAAENLEFETAARLRDRIASLEEGLDAGTGPRRDSSRGGARKGAPKGSKRGAKKRRR